MEVRAALWVATAGVVAGQLVAARWAMPASAAGGAALVAVLLAWRLRCSRGWLMGAALGLAAGALGVQRLEGVGGTGLPADHVARLALPTRTTLVGRVTGAPRRRPGQTVLLLDAERVGRGPTRRRVRGRVRVAVRGAGDWQHGHRLALEATLRRPRNFANPGSFDWVGHLARHGVHVTAAVWDGAAIRRLRAGPPDLRSRLERWRARLGRAIEAATPGAEGAVLAALVLGDEGGIDPALRAAFTRAGVVHVLSISGLHIGLVAAAGFLVARRLLVASERLALCLDVERAAAVASLVPVAFYAALAGLGLATLRATVMVAAAVAALLAGRRGDVLRALALAALLLTLAFPGAPLEVAFQLSFVSVAAIVVGVRRLAPGLTGRGGWRVRVATAFLVSGCALVGTAPLTAFHFQQVSLAGLVANPLTVPLFGSVVVVIGLLGVALEPVLPGVTALLFAAAGHALRPGLALVRLLGEAPWAAVDVPAPSLGELGLLTAALLGLAHGGRPGRIVLGAALVALAADAAWWVHVRFASPTLRVTFLDVGQGDAAVVELPGGGTLVIDAGGFPGSDFDTGAAVVAPFLATRKIRRPDALVMTHAHPDHAGGLAHLLLHRHPREFWWTGVPGSGPAWTRLEAALSASGARERRLGTGDPLPSFAAGAEVLHPPRGVRGLTLNDSSLTLRLGLGRTRVLLTGDVEARAETTLLGTPHRLAATVLKVPHHGSRTSSLPAFVQAVAPAVAVVSVGAENRYALPAPEVEARYRASGACVLRTDRCGAVTIETDGARLRVRAVRPACRCPALD